MFGNKGAFLSPPCLPSLLLIIKVAQFHCRKDEVGRSPPYSQGAATSATEEVALPLSPRPVCAGASPSQASRWRALRRLFQRRQCASSASPHTPQQTDASTGSTGRMGTTGRTETVGPSAVFHKQMCLCWGAAPWPRGPLSPVPPKSRAAHWTFQLCPRQNPGAAAAQWHLFARAARVRALHPAEPLRGRLGLCT